MGSKGALMAELKAAESANCSSINNTNHSTQYEEQLKVPVAIETPQTYYLVAMIDSGAQGNFINQSFVSENNIPTKKKAKARCISVVDGREIQGGRITHESTFTLFVNNHVKVITCDVVNIGQHDLILGASWLKKHNPEIHWRRWEICFCNCEDECYQPDPADIAEIYKSETGLPPQYQKFAKVFKPKEADKLPPHRPYQP